MEVDNNTRDVVVASSTESLFRELLGGLFGIGDGLNYRDCFLHRNGCEGAKTFSPVLASLPGKIYTSCARKAKLLKEKLSKDLKPKTPLLQDNTKLDAFKHAIVGFVSWVILA
jgi:hypothetical protein